MALVAILTTAVLSLAPVPKPPDPVPSNPAPAGGVGRRSESPQPPQAPPGAPGLASWYPARPVTCDGQPMPWWVKQWTASLSVPCGAMVTISGPAGSITVPVWDRGPEAWTGRVLDLSPAAFIAVAGNLWTGVVPVSWWSA